MDFDQCYKENSTSTWLSGNVSVMIDMTQTHKGLSTADTAPEQRRDLTLGTGRTVELSGSLTEKTELQAKVKKTLWPSVETYDSFESHNRVPAWVDGALM